MNIFLATQSQSSIEELFVAFIPLILIVLVFYFLLIRTNKKNRNQDKSKYNSNYNNFSTSDHIDEDIFVTSNQDEYKYYFNIFYTLTNEMGELFDDIYEAHLKDKSAGLMTLWNEYKNKADELLILFKKQDRLTKYAFQELKQKIKLIETQCKEIKIKLSEIQNNLKEQSSNIVFFSGCNTLEKLERRHKILCKAYHPDVGGDEETFKRMQNEYEKLKSILNF